MSVIFKIDTNLFDRLWDEYTEYCKSGLIQPDEDFKDWFEKVRFPMAKVSSYQLAGEDSKNYTIQQTFSLGGQITFNDEKDLTLFLLTM